MQNSRNKSKIAIRLSNPEHGTKPLKNRYIFHHRGLKYFSKVSCHRPTTVSPGGRGGGGGVEEVRGYSTNHYAGRLRPGVQPLTFLYTSFVRKGTPFRVLSTDK